MSGVLLAPAKLNLDLKVRGRLPDGSHAISTVMQAIGLYDELRIEPSERPAIVVDGFAAPASEENLALRAAAAVGAGCRITLQKRIPPGAGLGGGSSDAATVLRTLGEGRDDLPRLAAGLGADVPFFLVGGRARATGRGEILESLPDADGWFALAWPGFQIGSSAVYSAWDEVGGEGRNHLFRAASVVEPRLLAFAEALGDGWAMTGSGSAFFREAGDEAEAGDVVAGLACWTAVARALPAWG